MDTSSLGKIEKRPTNRQRKKYLFFRQDAFFFSTMPRTAPQEATGGS